MISSRCTNVSPPAVMIRPPLARAVREGSNCALDLARVADIDWLQFHTERRRNCLDGTQLAAAGSLPGIPQYRHARQAGRDLLEQLQPFPAHAVFGETEPGGIAAGPSQALDKAAADRVADVHEHDRHRTGRLK